jgi:signal peptidase II
MISKKIIRVALIAIIVFVNIGCDQVSKAVVRTTIPEGKTIEVLSDYFVLLKAENTGAFLGLGDQFTGVLGMFFLLGLPLVFLLGMLLYVFLDEKMDKGSLIAISCIIGGGIANLYDRFIYGSVTDFMHIDLGFVRSGIFNAADLSITFGFLYIIVMGWLAPKVAKVERLE